ncbi:MAG TPA: glycosyltransferase family 39 protein [Chloroflexota bacterium]|nr:glycosyltransferase family 39 protein [Chloroflexota bacterium]
MSLGRRMLGLIRRHPDVAALALIGVVAGVLRLAFLYRVPVILTGDSQSHYLPGYDLAFGNQFEPELRRPPGYAGFVAGTILLLGEELRALAFVQHVLGVATAMLIYLLGLLTFGRMAGLVAGLLVALNGALVLSSQSVMTETLFTFLLVATLMALLLAGRSGHWGWALLAGIGLGAASLTRPVAQALVILVPLAFLVYTRGPWPILRGICLVVFGFAIVLAPWMVRNLAEHGTLSAAGGLGRSLVARTIKYDEGYFDQSRPAADGDQKAEVRQFIRGKRNTIRNSRSVRSTQAGLMKEFGMTQAESDRWMRVVATEAILERPAYYVEGSLKMAWQIVLGKPKEDAYSERWVMRGDKDWVEQWEARVDHLLTPSTPAEQSSVETAQWLTEIFQPAALGPVLPILAGAGLLASVLVARPALVPALAGLGILLASAALDGPVPRYRYPLDPLIALLAAGALVVAVSWTVGIWRRARAVDSKRREPPQGSLISPAPVTGASR